jgi:hypothetical protein
MARATLALVLSAIVLAPAASAGAVDPDLIVISTGAEGGSYFYIGRRLSTELVVTYNQKVQVMTSEGSLDNLSRLDDPESAVNVALTQGDALRAYLERNPSFASEFIVLGDVGRECAFIVTNRDRGPASAADLKQEGAGQISVGDPGSGAALTFETMKSLAPAFAASEAVNVPLTEALLQVKVGSAYSPLRAAMLVQRPKRISPPVETVLGAPEAFRLVPIGSSDLPNAKLPDGRDVYSFERVSLGGERKGHQEVDTLCTRGLLLGAGDKLSKESRTRLSEILLQSGERIAGTDE